MRGHRRRSTVAAWALWGMAAGCGLGLLAGIILAGTIFGSSGFGAYYLGLACLAIIVSTAIGTFTGFIVGMVTGAALRLLSRTSTFGAPQGASINRLSAVAAVISGACTAALLYPVFRRQLVFVYPPSIAGALASIFLSRILPPGRNR
jgi:hypothetical protein